MPTHAEKQIVPYTPEQLFDLVADVAKYPRFLPWWSRPVFGTAPSTTCCRI